MSSGDFYIGLGPDATWVTTLGAHADPHCLAELEIGWPVLHAETVDAYLSALRILGEYWRSARLGVVYLPSGAWPETAWQYPNLAGCRFVFAEDASQPGTGRVWVAEPEDPSWRPAATTFAVTNRWEQSPVRHAVHPDTCRTVLIPSDPDATADYAYVHLLCDRVRRTTDKLDWRQANIGGDKESADASVHDLLVIAGNLVADAERLIARYDVRAALVSARRARDAVQAAQKIRTTLVS